jgi:NAD(P)-dependent dehydrogenase (short-subunit alcohol dehydrogenase family)
MGLGGTVAFVTGSAGGIGRAIAGALVRDAASIVIHDLGDPGQTERSRASFTVHAVTNANSGKPDVVRLIAAGANF